jgi:hypothetical protein
MRSLSVVLAAWLVSMGCVSNAYKISDEELTRLAQLPPEQRSRSVRVDQEIGGEDVGPAQPVGDGTEIIFIPNIQIDVDGGHRIPGTRSSPSVHGGGGGGLKGGSLGSGGGDKAEAIVFVVIAAVALVAVAAVEASRFDGQVQLHPMHPLHVIMRDGEQVVMPIAWLDPETAAYADHAIVLPREGPWRELSRAPLERHWTYGMYFGQGSYASAFDNNTAFGFATEIQGGYFFTQHYGLVANVFLGWRDAPSGGTLFESRFLAELQALPIDVGPLHMGVYGGLGDAYRNEDGVSDTARSTLAIDGGAMFQLELHTRIALTARLGAAYAHGENMQDLLLGLSVY